MATTPSASAPRPARPGGADAKSPPPGASRHTYAAIDLGTNNCRLLVASPTHDSFRVVDAFSRIVRLGEGLSLTGVLSDAAMIRAIAALKVCAAKIFSRRGKPVPGRGPR